MMLAGLADVLSSCVSRVRTRSMLILFCFVVKLESPTEIPAKEVAFYVYMLVRVGYTLGEAGAMRSMPLVSLHRSPTGTKLALFTRKINFVAPFSPTYCFCFSSTLVFICGSRLQAVF